MSASAIGFRPAVPGLSISASRLMSISRFTYSIVSMDRPDGARAPSAISSTITGSTRSITPRRSDMVTTRGSWFHPPLDHRRMEELTYGLDVRVRPDDLAVGIEDRRMGVDYAAIAGDHRALFLGEIHHSDPIRDEVVSIMPTLKDLGFTHFAMEMFHSASQRHLDEYAEGMMDRNDVIDQERIWQGDKQGLDDPRLHPLDLSVYPPYFKIADAAIASGLKVVGIEWCRYDGGGLVTVQREAFDEMGLTAETLREMAKGDGRLMSEIYHSVFESHVPVRNWHGAKVLTEILEEPEARVAVLGGLKHYGYMFDLRDNFSMNRFLEKRTGTGGPVAHFSTMWPAGDMMQLYRRSPRIMKRVYDAASELGIGDERFMLWMARSEEMDTPDYVIHLPS